MSEQEEVLETGNFVKRKQFSQATPEHYRLAFDFDANGQKVLEDLVARFCKSTYVRGGQDAERESCYRAGQASVVNLILTKINQANDPNYKTEELNDE
ncbi:Bbp19 family protein [Acinetobacter larvae]|uniref:Bbp19-like phage domain-containing protein n=1 Tax=Acinetobacter larvae TaxID=1789224 RepID=A0A1B2LXA6_9GAMM|nr:hypothetical protein [Acinetobacter larvae]AOA57566.1 hypothetical protein BFG52_03830 [Acinetobacter larvae]